MSSLKRLGIFFHMNLRDDAFRALLNVRKVHLEIDLMDYQRVIKFADPEMEAFDTLLNTMEDLISKIKRIDEALKKI